MAHDHEVDETGRIVQRNVHAGIPAGSPEEVEAVTGRPNDLGHRDQPPALANSSFAARRKAREESERRLKDRDKEGKAKAVDSAAAENKAVSSRRRK